MLKLMHYRRRRIYAASVRITTKAMQRKHHGWLRATIQHVPSKWH